MKKKTVSLILALIMTLSMLSGGALASGNDALLLAVTSGNCGKNLTWNFDENTGALTISGSGPMERTGSTPWYSYRKQIESLYLPEGITTIETDMFRGCTNLKSVTIPDGTYYIGIGAFAGCTNLASISIPNSVKEIGSSAFYGTAWLQSQPDYVVINNLLYEYKGNSSNITIPAGAEAVCDRAFENCDFIKNVTMPDSLKRIYDLAFSDCENIQSVKASPNIEFVGRDIFSSCPWIKSMGDFPMLNGFLLSYNGLGGDVVVPDGVTNITAHAFSLCYDLTSITLSAGTISIGEWAFFACDKLHEVNISEGVTSIGPYAFCGCESLKSIQLPSTIKEIGEEALGYGRASQTTWDYWPVEGGFTIYGYKGTAAETYAEAQSYGIEFSALSNVPSKMQLFYTRSGYSKGRFSDVSSQWYEPYVADAVRLGIVSGNGNGKFAPEDNLTLAQAIKMACVVHSIYNGNNGKFTQGDPWYQVYIDYALLNGIVKAGDFTDYNALATRAEMAYMFSNSLPKSEFALKNTINTLPDVSITDKYGSEIFLLYRAGILSGNDNVGTFGPNSRITRGQAAAIISRVALQGKRVTLNLQ